MRRILVLCLLLSAACAALYLKAWREADLAAPTPSPEGLALPLDDGYIFLQYARQALAGKPFHYTDGAPASTGASSLGYLGALTALMGLGLSGPWAAWWLGLAALAASLYSAARFARTAFPSLPAWLTPCLLGAHASFVSAHFQGMDTGLCLAALLAAAAAYAEERPPQFWTALAVLALARPEGQAAALVLAAAWARQAKDRRAASLAAGMALAVAPSLAFLAITGSPVPDSVRPKLMSVAVPDLAGRLAEGARYFAGSLLHVFGGIAGPGAVVGIAGGAQAGNPPGMHFPPLTLAASAWGLWRLGRGTQPRLRVLGPALGLWALAALALLSFQLAAGWHRHRYLAPLFPVMQLGLFAALAAWREDRSRPAPRLFFQLALTLWLGFGALRWPWFLEATRASAARYALANREAALALRSLPQPGAVAVADAGLLAWYSGRATADLIGVTEHAVALQAGQGVPGAVRMMRAWPPQRRPRFAVLHEDRPDLRSEVLVRAGLLADATPSDWRVQGMRLYRWNWGR